MVLDEPEGGSRDGAAAAVKAMISEEVQYLDRSSTSNDSQPGAKAAADHAKTQVHRAVTINHYEQVLDATLRNLDMAHLLPEILGRIRPMMDVDAVTLFMADSDGLSLLATASVGLEPAVERHIRIPRGMGLAGAVFARGHSKVLEEVTAATVANPVLLEKGIHSLAAVPIFVGNHPVGVLTVGSQASRSFQPNEVRLLEVVAERVGYAIERNRILDQVKHERGRAEKASRFKTTLLHMASHDVKTPLTVIRLELRALLQKDVPEGERARALAAMDRNITRLELTLDDFLDVARIEAGRFTLQLHRLDLRTLADEVTAMFRVKADSKHIELQVSGPEVILEGDERRLVQVVVNLVSNALRYTSTGSVGLVVESIGAGVQESPAIARLTVRDTGFGMTSEQMGRLFAPFGQVHEGPQQGTGLGLHLAKVIVEAHRGTIRVDSPGPGLGTTVTLEIPLVASTSKDVEPTVVLRHAPALTTPPLIPPGLPSAWPPSHSSPLPPRP
ncbi:MAG: GAF domain-containing sensor histidine kinase [Thermoplasmatota archaeon]